MDQEREALIVVREVVQRRVLGAREVRSLYVAWREESTRARAGSPPVTFLDHLVAKKAIDPVTREMLLLQLSMASDPDAQAEQKIRTLILEPPEPAPTPPATTPPQPLQPTLDGRLIPTRRPSARLAHSHADTPGAAMSRPRADTPANASPRPKEDGEVELVTPGGVPVGSEPPVGTRLGRYELLEVAGRGGMGTVFKARIHPSEEVCAVKVLGGPERMPGTSRRARFRREIMATARLDHEHVVRVRDAGHAGGIEFMVMDFVEGEGLERLLAKGTLTLAQRLEILVGVAAGVAHAHERGVIHRDLKPQNVLIDAQLVPRVVDFGLAKIEEQESGLTRTGASLGTPFYMAPEQFMGASQVGPKADVFSLGVMLYELITLERPFQGASSVEVADKVRNTDPPAPSSKNSQAIKALDAVFFRAIEKSQGRRYANAGEFLADLEAALAGGEVTARAARPTQKILKAAKAYRAPASGFLVACAIFVPLVIFLATRRDSVRPPTPSGSGIATVLAQAVETARGELEAVPAPGDPELPRGDEAPRLAVEIDREVLAPAASGDLARARAGLARVRVEAPLRAELTRELELLSRLRGLVLALARAGALGERLDAWGTDVPARAPRVLEDGAIEFGGFAPGPPRGAPPLGLPAELSEEGRATCLRALALGTASLARITGDDAAARRGLAVLALARGEPLPAALRADEARALARVAGWVKSGRETARSQREEEARASWEKLVHAGDPLEWAGRFQGTRFLQERKRAWSLLAAERLGPRLLGATVLDPARGKLGWDAVEGNLLAWNAAFVSSRARVQRTAVGLELSGVRLALDAGRADGGAVVLDAVKGPVELALGRHVLGFDERGRPWARVGDRDIEATGTADWKQSRRFEAAAGTDGVIFRLDATRLALLPVDAQAVGTSLALSVEQARIRSFEVLPAPGALGTVLPRFAELALSRLPGEGRVLRDGADGRSGLVLEGGWTVGADGTLAANGPARLTALAPVDAGSAQLAVEATEGVSLGWGEPRFPVPVTETLIFEKLELQAHEADALTVGDILRFSLPRASGPRRFTLRIDAGAHATVRGLTLSE